MNSLHELKKIAEAGNGRANADNLHGILRQRPDLIGTMMELFLSYAEPASRRVIWALDLYAEENPEVLLTYLDTLAEHLPQATHDAHKRHTLRILRRYPIPEKHLGLLVSCCFDYLLSIHETPAIKVYAMDLLYNACAIVPDIRQELTDTLTLRLHEESAGVQSRAVKILNRLNQNIP